MIYAWPAGKRDQKGNLAVVPHRWQDITTIALGCLPAREIVFSWLYPHPPPDRL